MSFQLCSLLSVEYLLRFEDVLLNMCLYDIFSPNHISIKSRGPIHKCNRR